MNLGSFGYRLGDLSSLVFVCASPCRQSSACGLLWQSHRGLVVLDPRRWNIEPNVIAANASFAALFGKPFIDLANAKLFCAACESFADGANEHVFEVAESAAGFEEFEVGVYEFVDELRGEVVEWESGDDEVEGSFRLVVLQGKLVDGRLVFGCDPVRFSVEALVECIDEVGVEFNEVQLVVWLQEFDDAVGDRPGAGADFEDAYGLRIVAGGEIASHCSSEEAAAGSDGTGRFEAFSKLGEEGEIVLE